MQQDIEAAVKVLAKVPEMINFVTGLTNQEADTSISEVVKTLNDKFIEPLTYMENSIKARKERSPSAEAASENVYFDIKRTLEVYHEMKSNLLDMNQLQASDQQREERFREEVTEMLVMLGALAGTILDRFEKRLDRHNAESAQAKERCKEIMAKDEKLGQEARKRVLSFGYSTLELAEESKKDMELRAANKPKELK